ncbi:MAG TPA: SIMPL domain-containing protein [Candidatus Angelobacter sp.]|nr:SIMPL domain-containing protein [Candidatus Angelobacter sp.]
MAVATATGLLLVGCGTTPAPSSPGVAAPSPKAAVSTGTGRTVTVVGTGTVTAKPDIALVTLGVTMTGAAAVDAVNAAEGAAGKLTAALVAGGVAREDIATTQYAVAQHWNPATQRNEGWEVRDGFTVAVHDVGTVGGLIATASSAVPNVLWVNDVRFDLSNTAGVAGTARDLAMKDAHNHAAAWAQLAGKQLGDITSVSEQQAPATFAPSQGGTGGGGGGGIQVGTGRLTVTITVVYAVT